MQPNKKIDVESQKCRNFRKKTKHSATFFRQLFARYKHMKFSLLILILILILFPIAALSEGVKEIRILNNEFEVVKIISDPDLLAIAYSEWKLLVPVDSLPNTNWTHKIDITSKSIGGRWLYNKQGYIAKLNKRLQPIYQVKDVASFNQVYLDLK